MVAESRTLEPVAVQGIDDVAAGHRSISENRKRKLRPGCPGSRSHITGAGPRGVDYLTASLGQTSFLETKSGHHPGRRVAGSNPPGFSTKRQFGKRAS